MSLALRGVILKGSDNFLAKEIEGLKIISEFSFVNVPKWSTLTSYDYRARARALVKALQTLYISTIYDALLRSELVIEADSFWFVS